jgi:hypothetical protein
VEECTYFWGVNTSWGIDTAESKGPLHQEDNQAPQPTHIISQDGIVVDPEKIEAIREWPVPRNVSEVRSFMCLDGFYIRFIAGFSRISHPITSLQRKENKFQWIDECERSFQ